MLDPALRFNFAEVGGIRLHYAACGNGDKLVILLHGFPEFWYAWQHQLPALGDQYTVVAPDMRGYNLSDKPPHRDDYRLELLIEDVVGLIRHFGMEQSVIVGHDWGAIVAWAVAEKHPEMVSHLVALQVPPLPVWWSNLRPPQLLRSWYVLFFQIPGLPEWTMRRANFAFLDTTFAKTSLRPNAFTPEDVLHYKEALGRPGALTAMINYYRALAHGTRNSTNPAPRGVHVPTLFIYAEKDFAILPRTVRNVASYVDVTYREVRIPDCGHWVQNEAPEAVNAALRDFLNEA